MRPQEKGPASLQGQPTRIASLSKEKAWLKNDTDLGISQDPPWPSRTESLSARMLVVETKLDVILALAGGVR